MSLAQPLIMELESEANHTRKALERVPADRFDWKPHEKSFDMGRLASHLAELPTWINEVLGADEFVMPENYAPWVAKDLGELLEKLDSSVAAAKEALQQATDERLQAPWRLVAGGEVVFEFPRVGVIKGMVLNHTVHHRGQLTVYLRLNDLPVPAIYGPSADEQS